MSKSRLSPLVRDANWVLGFGPGTIWSDGEASGFKPNRLGELKEMGVLLPHPEEKGLLIVSALPLFRS